MSSTTLGEIVEKVRAKNAGPFWLTLDIFCGDPERYQRAVQAVDTDAVAALFQQPASNLQRYDIETLNVIKISMPRPVVQGSREDRDMHASQWAWLLASLEVSNQ